MVPEEAPGDQWGVKGAGLGILVQAWEQALKWGPRGVLVWEKSVKAEEEEEDLVANGSQAGAGRVGGEGARRSQFLGVPVFVSPHVSFDCLSVSFPFCHSGVLPASVSHSPRLWRPRLSPRLVAGEAGGGPGAGLAALPGGVKDRCQGPSLSESRWRPGRIWIEGRRPRPAG